MSGKLIPAIAVVLAALVIAGLVCWPDSPPSNPAGSPLGTGPSLRIEHTDLRITSEFDTGSVHVLVKNVGVVPSRITDILLDNRPVPTYGVDSAEPASASANTPEAAERRPDTPEHRSTDTLEDRSTFRLTYWSRFTPSSALAPGEVGWLTLKLVSPPTRTMSLELRAVGVEGGGERPLPPVLSQIERQPTAITLARLTFAPDGERAYGYIRNNAENPYEIHGLEINGHEVLEDAWLPEKTIPPGGMGVFAFRPGHPFARGEWMTVRAVMQDGTTVAGQARAFFGFPLGVESGGVPAGGFGLDSRTRVWRPAFLKALNPRETGENIPSDALGGFNAMNCVLCSAGEMPRDRFGTAAALLRRYGNAARLAPGVPVIVNPCRVQADRAYPLFAETVDALLANPAVVTEDAPPEAREHPLATAARMARLGRKASEPNLYYPLVDTSIMGSAANTLDNFADPDALRARVFTFLAEGADGLLYRHRWNADTSRGQALTRMIPTLNAEIKILAPWLEIGAAAESLPLDGHTGFRLYTRWAGEKGLLAFVIRDDSQSVDSEPETLSVHFPLPAWAKPTGMFRVAPDGLQEMPDAILAEGATRFSIPLPKAAAAYVIKYRE